MTKLINFNHETYSKQNTHICFYGTFICNLDWDILKSDVTNEYLLEILNTIADYGFYFIQVDDKDLKINSYFLISGTQLKWMINNKDNLDFKFELIKEPDRNLDVYNCYGKDIKSKNDLVKIIKRQELNIY